MTHTLSKKIGAVLCVLSVIMWVMAGVLTQQAFAEEATGTLSMQCVKDDRILDGMHWKIYRVGERDGETFKLQGDFENYHVTFGEVDKNANTWDTNVIANAASTLQIYTIIDQLPFRDEGWTDANGMLKFSGLEDGLYLVCGDTYHKGAYYYAPSALFFEMSNEEDAYLNAFPKFETKTQDAFSGSKNIKFSVRKIWRNDEDQPWNRAVSIKVEIYKDRKLLEPLTLSESNNWYYEWEGDEAAEWHVIEREIPDGYTMVVQQNKGEEEVQYLIVNTHDDIFGDHNEQTAPTGTTPRMDWNEHTQTAPTGDQNQHTGTTTAETVEHHSASGTSIEMTGSQVTTTATNVTQGHKDGSGTSTEVSGGSGNSESSHTSETVATVVTDESGNVSTTQTQGGGKKDSSDGRTVETVKKTVQTTSKTVGGGGGNSGGGGKLPQTGQLWLPVPFLSIGGMLFMGVGLHLRKKENE